MHLGMTNKMRLGMVVISAIRLIDTCANGGRAVTRRG